MANNLKYVAFGFIFVITVVAVLYFIGIKSSNTDNVIQNVEKTEQAAPAKETNAVQVGMNSSDLNEQMNLAEDYRKKADFENSLQILDKILKNDPNNSNAYRTKGNVYGGQKNILEAKKMYDKAIETDNSQNNMASVYYDMSWMYALNGDMKKASEIINKASKLSPDDENIKQRLKEYSK